MKLGYAIGTKQQQKMVMSPERIQALNILQAGGAELGDYIKQSGSQCKAVQGFISLLFLWHRMPPYSFTLHTKQRSFPLGSGGITSSQQISILNSSP